MTEKENLGLNQEWKIPTEASTKSSAEQISKKRYWEELQSLSREEVSERYQHYKKEFDDFIFFSKKPIFR